MTGNVRIDSTVLMDLCTQADRKLECWGTKDVCLGKDINGLIKVCKAIEGHRIEIELDINTFAKICNLAKG